MAKRKLWIHKAIKREGSLKRWAKKHGFIHANKISLERAYKYAKRKGLTRRLRQINLAKTLRRLAKR